MCLRRLRRISARGRGRLRLTGRSRARAETWQDVFAVPPVGPPDWAAARPCLASSGPVSSPPQLPQRTRQQTAPELTSFSFCHSDRRAAPFPRLVPPVARKSGAVARKGSRVDGESSPGDQSEESRRRNGENLGSAPKISESQVNRSGRDQPGKKMSGRWGCRPLVGMGVMEVQKFEVATERFGCREGFPSWSSAGRRPGPESLLILPVTSARVDSPLVHFVSVQRYRPKNSQCLRLNVIAALCASKSLAPAFAARAVNVLR
jgi:hypothetical protein